MPFSVQHHYKYEAGRKEGSVLIAVKQTLKEAVETVQTLYHGRGMPGRDFVTITGDGGAEYLRMEVDYMAQFEAVEGQQWHFSSSSGSGTYTTQVNTTGILSCNCKGWAIKKANKARSCKHTDEVCRTQNIQVEVKGQYYFVVDKTILNAKGKFVPSDLSKATGPQAKFAILVKDYEDAIAIMAALDPKDMYQAAAAVEMAKFKVESYMLLLEEHGIDGSAQFQRAEAKLQELRA